MQRTLETLRTQTRSIGTRSSFSTSSLSRSTPSSSSSSSTATPESASTPSHYLVTLLRSPLHLNPAIKSSLSSLGLYKRLSSSIVPITPTNQGYILRAKELVGIKPVTEEEVRRLGSEEWRNRQGEGRQGSGLRVREGAGVGGVIRVGSERARGEERGFKVVN
ncbi:mitochondrial 54S ribosomal protein uL30m MRPL33 [Sporobolomyces salmoneus]|uniref:mitochondrial 54S ribosomal protein uL30m MRPL33 n=1 Tax=Sporobolomyces salmoneus TaxID=183962 RepID=UPI00317423CE